MMDSERCRLMHAFHQEAKVGSLRKGFKREEKN